jgi:hypothetical protein
VIRLPYDTIFDVQYQCHLYRTGGSVQALVSKQALNHRIQTPEEYIQYTVVSGGKGDTQKGYAQSRDRGRFEQRVPSK